VRVRPMYLWSSERAPYNHPPLFFNKNTPTKPYTAPLPPLIKKCDVREWPKNASTGISLLLSLAANPLISGFGSTSRRQIKASNQLSSGTKYRANNGIHRG
jgi:hypothetical protein